MTTALGGMLAYVLVQFLIGAWVSRRISSESDYILAGRRLGPGLTMFSVFATYFGAEAIVASGGAVYDKGLSGAVVDPIAYAGAIVLVGLCFARALWNRGLTTFADLFRERYSPGVERLVVIVLLPGSVIWAAAQVRAFGQVMDANSGMGLKTGIVLAAVLVTMYAIIGGLLADAVTDLIQGVAVLVGLLILGSIVAVQVGGVAAGLDRVPPAQLEFFDTTEGVLGTIEKLAVPICGTIVAVELISRFLGARSAEVARSATAVGGIVYLLIGMVPVFLGLVGPNLLPKVHDSEQTVARLAEIYLPGVLYVAFVGAIISAILSTVHSALHAPASQISHNIVVRIIPGLSSSGKLWAVRGTVMVLCMVAFTIAITAAGIHEIVETASAFGSAGVFVATLFALFTRYGGPLSAYLSIMAGLIFWAAGKYLFAMGTPYLLGLTAAASGYVAGAFLQRD